jgi:hypothetical protein
MATAGVPLRPMRNSAAGELPVDVQVCSVPPSTAHPQVAVPGSTRHSIRYQVSADSVAIVAEVVDPTQVSAPPEVISRRAQRFNAPLETSAMVVVPLGKSSMRK